MNDLDYLLPKTKEVLLSLAHFNWLQNFIFVGGSGLSLYLHHRLSEDIDLFSWEENLDKELILPDLQKFYGKTLQIINNTPKQIDLQIKQVKVTFFANGWDALQDYQKLHNNLQVANLDLLVGMKLNTLFLRAKFRDYYDLYAISKFGYELPRMYQIIFDLMPGINKRLFQMAITYTDDIEEDNILYLNPKYPISKEKIGKYFEELIFKWLES